MNPEEAIKAIRAQGGTDADVEAYLRSIGAQEVGPSRADTELREMLDRAHAAERGRERQRVSAEEKKLTGIDRLGANLQRFSDMATFGVSGLLDDAITAIANSPRGVPSAMREQFRVNRQARRMAQEGLSPVDRVASTLVGAAANPVGAVIKVPAAAGLLGRIGATSADAALQGGVTGAVEGLEDVSREGLLEAGRRGAAGAAGAVVGSNLIRGAGAVVRGANTLRRVAQAKPIDVYGAQMDDAMKAADDLFFGLARSEAKAIGSTPAIREILEHPTVRPFAEAQRRRPINQQATDAEIFLNAYRRMSEVERRNLNSQEGSAELLAKIRDETEDIAFVKPMMKEATTTRGEVVVPGRVQTAPAPSTAQSPAPSVREALDAYRTRLGQTVTRREGTVMQQQAREALERQDMERVANPSLRGAPQPMRAVTRESATIPIPEGMPTFPLANAAHAAHRRDKEAFVDVADAVSRVMRKTSQKGENKIKFESPEALRRGILDMTPSEAEAAIAGLLGRGREAMRLSANPLTGFGIPGAAIRTALLPSQVNPYLRLLEKQAGRQPRLFDNPVVMERGLGTASRTIGGLLSQY